MLHQIPSALIVIVIRLYQKYISPLTPPSCRFYPTCSEYALQAVEKHGFVRGCAKSLKRILKCHPFHPGGYDPV
jgi:putative membrane protein insertion efficiency factor